MMQVKKPLRLYLHIPFCIRKCNYCDFLSFAAGQQERSRYLAALCRELTCCRDFFTSYELTSIFIGGGTPSVLQPSELACLLDMVYKNCTVRADAEITIEANPGTLDAEKLFMYVTAGINRLSLGLQSTWDEELVLLGRIHTYETFLKEYRLAREAGFHNINIDLMSALPKQKSEDFEKSLHRVIDLAPEHISVYGLIIEEGTTFYPLYREGGSLYHTLPDEETDRKIYHETKRVLAQAGYERYEISNYSRQGFQCRHNIGYWKRDEYLGLGLGAASLIGERRFSEPNTLATYYQQVQEETDLAEKRHHMGEVLSPEDCMAEFMFLGLRMTQGVSRTEFYRVFQQELNNVYGDQLSYHIQTGLLCSDGEFFYLTERGIDLSNVVFTSFLK